ncbi:hypothetical protein D3C84_1002790 [compost metagenome]
MRMVDLGQGHDLVVAMLVSAVQRPVHRFFPFAAGAVGALARGAFGGRGKAYRAIVEGGEHRRQTVQRFGTCEFQCYRVGAGFRYRSGDDQVVDIDGHRVFS